MDRNEIYEMVITEMSEDALRERKESCSEKEKQLYKDASELSRKRTDVLKQLSKEDQQVLEDYLAKINLIAEHECRHLYVQGAKDCVELLKKLGVL